MTVHEMQTIVRPYADATFAEIVEAVDRSYVHSELPSFELLSEITQRAERFASDDDEEFYNLVDQIGFAYSDGVLPERSLLDELIEKAQRFMKEDLESE